MKKISIVTPCYNEELNVEECWKAVKDLFDTQLKGYVREHIFCDNASSDRTVEILKEIAARDDGVKIIVNARNFGPLRSNYNGVMAASGDAVLLCMVADLQDPPELIPDFVKHWENGYEVVYGVRAVREEGLILRNIRRAYYELLTRLADLTVPPGVGDFQLVDRRIVEAMRKIDDVHPFMRMMTFECGGKAIGVEYTWRARKRGLSKNNFLRLFDQGINGFVTFTVLPVRLVLFAGFVLAALSLLYAFFVLALAVQRLGCRARDRDDHYRDLFLRRRSACRGRPDRRVYPRDLRAGEKEARRLRERAHQFRDDRSRRKGQGCLTRNLSPRRTATRP